MMYFLIRGKTMNYKEHIDEYFKRFKSGQRTTELYNVIVHEMSQKYRQYIDRGYSKEDTEEKLTKEISNLRGHYPVLNSLPRKNVSGGDVGNTLKYVSFGLYLVLTAAIYAYAPVLGIVPQLLMGLLFLNWANASQDKHIAYARKRYIFMLMVLLVVQTIGMWIRYTPSAPMIPGLIMIYLVVFLFMAIIYFATINQGRELPKRSLYMSLLIGPLITRDVNAGVYIGFVLMSIMAIVFHFLLFGLDSLLSIW